jgi:hypothetical protein
MRGLAAPLAMAVLMLAAPGCGDDDDDGGGTPDAAATFDASASDAGADQLDPPPPPGGQQLASLPYTLQPGEEKFFCYTFDSPPDEKAITEVQAISGLVVHHVLLVTMTQKRPEAFYECDQLLDLTWRPVWAGGTGGNGLVLPTGAGFKIAGGSQYMIQYHLQNTTESPVTERSGINLRYAEDAAALEPAGFYALGSFSLTIPAAAVDFQQTVGCPAPVDMHVFAAFPHMHKSGKRLHIETGPSENALAPLYDIDPWVFGDQPMDPLDQFIAAGDFVRSTCHWDNDTGAQINFGESSDNEMCFAVLFYWPAPDQMGCIE